MQHSLDSPVDDFGSPNSKSSAGGAGAGAGRGGEYTAMDVPTESQALLSKAVVVPKVGSTRRGVEICVALFGATAVALMSGTPNAFNAISHKLQADTGTSDGFVSLLTGIGVAGLQISLPAGILADNFGTTVAVLVAAVAVVAGYLAMSFVSSPGLLVACYILVGIGSGCTYLSALQTAINLGYSAGVAAVSLAMSLSLSFTILLSNTYISDTGCDAAVCWHDYVRLYGVVAAGCMFGGGFCMSIGRKYQSGKNEDGEMRPRAISMDMEMPFHKTLRVFKKPFFLAMFIAYTIAIGAGVFIIASARQLWANYDHQPNNYSQLISVLFSICTAAGNVITPFIAAHLHSTGRMERAHFTALVLAAIAVVFGLLFVLTAVDSLRHGPWGWKVLYMILMALVGFEFGTSLTLFPTVLADCYGFTNFGAYMSFLQSGAAAAAVLIPTVASSVATATGEYSPMHAAFFVLMLIGAAFMRFVPSRSISFQPRSQFAGASTASTESLKPKTGFAGDA